MDVAEFLRKIRRQAVVAIVSDDELMERMVLKGGNALDLIYQVSVRTSLDLDFSIDGAFDDLEQIRNRLESLLKQAFLEIGLQVFDFEIRETPEELTEELIDFWGGYKVEFKLIDKEKHARFQDDLEKLRRNAIGVGKQQSTKFTVEISKHEFCDGKIAHSLDGYRVYAYSPAMLVAEKIRAICQQHPQYVKSVRSHRRNRARDFIDIYTLIERFQIDFNEPSFQSLVRNIFEIKRVPLSLAGKLTEQRDFHRTGFASVRDTVHPEFESKLMEFDFYADYVEARCELLKVLWNK